MTIYKYLAPRWVTVLRSSEIRVTQAAALNDPFELNAYFDLLLDEDVVLQGMIDTPIDITPNLRAAYEKLPGAAKAQMPLGLFLAFAKATLDSPKGARMMRETLGVALGAMRNATPGARDHLNDLLRTKIGILSLSRTPTGVLLWSHYAASHCGFVIGFDDSHKFFNRRRSAADEFYHLRPVTYQTPVGFAAMDHVDWNAVLCAKGPDWSWEDEVRMLVPVALASRSIVTAPVPIYLEQFPENAVTDVIVGARASAALVTELTELLAESRYSHVAVRRARLDNKNESVLIE